MKRRLSQLIITTNRVELRVFPNYVPHTHWHEMSTCGPLLLWYHFRRQTDLNSLQPAQITSIKKERSTVVIRYSRMMKGLHVIVSHNGPLPSPYAMVRKALERLPVHVMLTHLLDDHFPLLSLPTSRSLANSLTHTHAR